MENEPQLPHILEPGRLISQRIGLGGIDNAFVEMSDYGNSGFSIVEPYSSYNSPAATSVHA